MRNTKIEILILSFIFCLTSCYCQNINNKTDIPKYNVGFSIHLPIYRGYEIDTNNNEIKIYYFKNVLWKNLLKSRYKKDSKNKIMFPPFKDYGIYKGDTLYHSLTTFFDSTYDQQKGHDAYAIYQGDTIYIINPPPDSLWIGSDAIVGQIKKVRCIKLLRDTFKIKTDTYLSGKKAHLTTFPDRPMKNNPASLKYLLPDTFNYYIPVYADLNNDGTDELILYYAEEEPNINRGSYVGDIGAHVEIFYKNNQQWKSCQKIDCSKLMQYNALESIGVIKFKNFKYPIIYLCGTMEESVGYTSQTIVLLIGNKNHENYNGLKIYYLNKDK